MTPTQINRDKNSQKMEDCFGYADCEEEWLDEENETEDEKEQLESYLECSKCRLANICNVSETYMEER